MTDLDPLFDFEGLPATLTLGPHTRSPLRFPRHRPQRGLATLGRTQLMWRTRARLFEVRQTVGEARQLRIYPNFAALSRYAWLSGDRRLAQMGIKNFVAARPGH